MSTPLIKALAQEMKSQGWNLKSYAEYLGYHPVKIQRWVSGEQSPMTYQMEEAWRGLGFTLLPVRLPSIKPRISFGSTPKPFQKTFDNSHPVVSMLLKEIEQRQISQSDILNEVGLALNLFRCWMDDQKAGRLDDVEACFNVMGMSLLPFPVKTLGVIYA